MTIDEIVERASRLSPLERQLRDALRECQGTLAALIDPTNKASGVGIMTAWASCVAAESKARAALSAAEEIEKQRSGQAQS